MQVPSREPSSRSPQSGDIYHPRLPSLPFPRALPWDPRGMATGLHGPATRPCVILPPGQDLAVPVPPTHPCCLRLPATQAGCGLCLLRALRQHCGSLASRTAQDVLSTHLSTCYGPFLHHAPRLRWRRPRPFPLRPRHNAQDRRVLSSGRVKRGCPSQAPSLVSLPLLTHLRPPPG